MKLHFPLRLLIAQSLNGTTFIAQAADFTVAYQTNVDPAKVEQADNAYEKATYSKIYWSK
ncbi:taurine ABC transporter substrate-binding protein, partial [Pseudomonas syringae pv. tagetis]